MFRARVDLKQDLNRIRFIVVSAADSPDAGCAGERGKVWGVGGPRTYGRNVANGTTVAALGRRGRARMSCSPSCYHGVED